MGQFSKSYVNRPISNRYQAKEYSCMVYAKMVALFQMIRRDETAKFKDLPGKSRQRRIVSHAHCLTVCEKTRSHHETQPRIRRKRDVKLPRQQNFFQSFLRKTVICIVERQRKSMGYRFVRNRKKVRVIEIPKKIAESKVKNSFYCTVNILITINCRNNKRKLKDTSRL